MALQLKQRIGIRVKSARSARGLTQEHLAELIERTTESVSNIERGQTLPPIDTLDVIASVLDVPLSAFFDDAEKTADADRERIELQTRLSHLARSLPTADLRVAVAQVEALANRR
jgi:transcriptional regulator with XRE-family HTH domain